MSKTGQISNHINSLQRVALKLLRKGRPRNRDQHMDRTGIFREDISAVQPGDIAIIHNGDTPILSKGRYPTILSRGAFNPGLPTGNHSPSSGELSSVYAHSPGSSIPVRQRDRQRLHRDLYLDLAFEHVRDNVRGDCHWRLGLPNWRRSCPNRRRIPAIQ